MEQIAPPVLVVGWAPDGALRILDQRRLPDEVVHRDLQTVAEVADAIRTLAVRGAPAIGVAAAMGLAVAAGGAELADVERAAATLRATRPTAVNLTWALDRMLGVARANASLSAATRRDALREEAERIRAQDATMCQAIGEHGAALIESGMRVLTHCNAGALATAGIGTALAPLYVAHARGAKLQVFAGETRPLLQGARLTAWELAQAGIPVTVLTDGMAASVMARGGIDLVIVGADRIAANGDVANKIGTYGLAVLARYHGVPFVVAAPTSTIDPDAENGSTIVIEERDPSEVTHLSGVRVAAAGALILNPAFDITPHTLVTRIVTDRGIFAPPYVFAPNSAVLPPPA